MGEWLFEGATVDLGMTLPQSPKFQVAMANPQFSHCQGLHDWYLLFFHEPDCLYNPVVGHVMCDPGST